MCVSVFIGPSFELLSTHETRVGHGENCIAWADTFLFLD